MTIKNVLERPTCHYSEHKAAPPSAISRPAGVQVTDGEAQALVQGVTGHAGRPMNLFDFIRFATTSSTNFMYSLKPVVLHL